MTEFSNIIINTDNYKHCHYPLYPPGTEYVSSYIESRGGEFPVNMFVGLQAFIREFLMHPITLEDIDEAEFTEREQGMHFNRDNWLGILNDHGGYLPVEIEAVPEGTVLPVKNVLVQVINTDPKYWWATSFFETALLRAVWYPTTIGTISWLAKQVIKESLAQTSDHPESLRFILHDYGARGVSSQESAALGGLAHLVNFDQSDTVPGIVAAKKYYNARGMVVHHNTDIWGDSGPIDGLGGGIWAMGAAWMVRDLWEHWLFTGDTVFLRDTAYPLMKGAAEFVLGWLIPDANGRLVTALLEGGKVKLEWNVPRVYWAKDWAKLLMNAALLGADSLPRGGVVVVEAGADAALPSFKIRATGLNARVTEEVEKSIRGETEPGSLDARAIQPFLTHRLSRSVNAGLSIGLAPDGVVEISAG